MGQALAPRTHARAKKQGQMRNLVVDLMKKYDKGKTGTLSREEVQAMAADMLTADMLAGGLNDEDVDLIMRCGGENCRPEVSAKELPEAIAVMMIIKEENQYFHDLFVKHDKNKSGKLEEAQLAALLTELSEGVAPSSLDLSYVLKQCEPRGKADPIGEPDLKIAIACWYCLKQPAQDEIKSMFKAWDKAGNGVISLEEMTTVMKKIGANEKDLAGLEIIFKEADKNKNGVLDYNEFVDWVSGGAVPLGLGVEGRADKSAITTGFLRAPAAPVAPPAA